MALVGILLAAGQGLRFGGDKLLAQVSGEPLGVAACRHLLAAVHDVIAIVRPGDAVLAAALEASGAHAMPCVDAECGMGASLAFGVRATIDADGWIVALADMPWIRADTITQIAVAIERGAALAAPFYRGMRGHPVGFGKSFAAKLAALDGDEGAKRVLGEHVDAMVRVHVDDPGVLRDIDLPADLRP